jgi:hypothetical protein
LSLENPIYLGDAVYATFTDYHVIVTTEHHEPHEANNVIYLEPSVLNKLVEWWGQVEKEGRVDG